MYYRITGYYPEKNVSFIADSNGKFEKLWQFSAYLKSKGCDIITVSRQENMIDEKTPPIERRTGSQIPFESAQQARLRDRHPDGSDQI